MARTSGAFREVRSRSQFAPNTTATTAIAAVPMMSTPEMRRPTRTLLRSENRRAGPLV